MAIVTKTILALVILLGTLAQTACADTASQEQRMQDFAADAVEDAVSPLESRIEALEDQVSVLEGTVGDLESKVQYLEDELN